jgi:hypothetical protein
VAAQPDRGGYITQSNWTHYWHAVRTSAGMPGQEFYELKHRAIQWMIDPVEDGGLGLDPQTVAMMVGHDDGGWLISTVYTKLADQRAQNRARRAMDDYQERQKAVGPPPAPGRGRIAQPVSLFVHCESLRTAIPDARV